MTPQLPAALEASFWIKQLRPDLPIVLGGAHISATHADVLDQTEHVDFLIDGEGEITTLEVCKLLRAGQRLPDCLAGIEGIIYRDADRPSSAILRAPSSASSTSSPRSTTRWST